MLPRLALLVAVVTWGATFVVVQKALEDLPVFHLLAARFTLGALLLLPLVRRRGGHRQARREGVMIGVALFAGYTFQTYGLLWTTPSRSAFLTGLSVLFVPALVWLSGRERLRPGPLAGVVLAICGLWFLYQPGATGPQFGLGDALTLICALAFAGHVLLVEGAVRRHRVETLAVLQFAVVAALSAPSLAFEPPTRGELTLLALGAVLVTGVFATALAFVCQLYAQRYLSATETAIFLSLEPVVAAFVSLLAGAESWSVYLGIGAVLLVMAMLAAQLGAAPVRQPAPGAANPRA